MTALLRQYWDVKSENYDKIVAHRMCDCYWFYYNDAFILSKLLDVKYGFWGGRFFCQFHER